MSYHVSSFDNGVYKLVSSNSGYPEIHLRLAREWNVSTYLYVLNDVVKSSQSIKNNLQSHGSITDAIQIDYLSKSQHLGLVNSDTFDLPARLIYHSRDANGNYYDDPSLVADARIFVNSDQYLPETGYNLDIPLIGYIKSIITSVAHELDHPFSGAHAWNAAGRKYPTHSEIMADSAYSFQVSVWLEYGWATKATSGPYAGQFVVAVGTAGAVDANNSPVAIGGIARGGAIVVDIATAKNVYLEDIFNGFEKLRVEDPNPNAAYRGEGKDLSVTLQGPNGETISDAFTRKRLVDPNRALLYAEVGGVIGASLGNYLSKGNVLKGIVYSSVLGEIGERVGLALAGAPNANVPQHLKIDAQGNAIAPSFSQDVLARMQGAAIGTVSSILAAELGNVLGLEGFGAELFNVTSSSVISKVISNALTPAAGLPGHKSLLDGIFKGGEFTGGDLIGGAIGGFIGAKLGAALVRPETEAAVVLSSIGSAVGAWAGTTGALGIGSVSSALGAIGITSKLALNVLLPGIGAFVGFVLGALIGNLFGRKKPKTPTASAETSLQLPYARYEVGNWVAANGGSLSLVQSMASNARDILNGMIQQITYGDDRATVSNLNGTNTTQAYGHTGNQLYVKLNGVTKNVSSADEAVEIGTLSAIRNTKVIGGDLFLKRAVLSSTAQDLVAFTGDLQTAKDYAFYSSNKELVNGYIKDAFSTLTQAEKDLYDGAIKDIITKVIAGGTSSLTTSELATYNRNSAQYDRVIAAVGNQTVSSLSQADQDFYNNLNKTVVDKILTGGTESLTSGELTYYTTYKTTFDKVIAAVGAQTVANPWLVTLLRSSELKLDQWATSDFYGGLRGFLSSFGISKTGSTAQFEDYIVYSYVTELGSKNLRIGSDKWVNETSISSNAAKVYRLYKGLLGRAPDAIGLENYVFQLETGAKDILGVAASIVNSDEFRNVTGGLSDNDYVAYLYTTVQNRPANQTEINSWLADMANGKTRAGVALGFTESGEYVETTRSTVEAGLNYISHDNPGMFDVLPQAGGKGDYVVIEDMTKVGLIQQLTGTTTNGNDVVDYSSSTAGVTINDWREVNGVWQNGGDNIFIGGSGNDTLVGGAGSDWLDGRGGSDTMWGADGNDVMINPTGGGQLHGQNGDDYIMGGYAYGEDGNDTLVGRAWNDHLEGGNGNDLFIMAKDFSNNNYLGGDWGVNSDPSGRDTVSAERIDVGVTFDLDNRPTWWTGSGNGMYENPNARELQLYNLSNGQWLSSMYITSMENATGSMFNDLFYGTLTSNVLKGLAGNDTIHARAGDDVVEGGAGSDTLYGGDGNDFLSYEGSSEGVFVNLSLGDAFGGDAEGDVFSQFENIRGSKLSDELKGDSGTNVIEGGDGDDWIVATGGGTLVTEIVEEYDDWGYGGSYTYEYTYVTGADVYNGGSGNDTVDYSEATSGIVAYLGSYTITNSSRLASPGTGSSGLAQGHTYVSIEDIVGTAYADSLSAGNGSQTFEGGGGNDTLSGGGGADTYMFGRGDGQDIIVDTNVDNNVLYLGEDVRWTDIYNGTAGGSNGFMDLGIRGTSDKIRVNGFFANVTNNPLKTINLGGVAQLDISTWSYATSGATGGNDTIHGWTGQRDWSFGYEGNDTLTGSGNNNETEQNILFGGLGDDYLKASVGDDQYVYERGEGIDTIEDSGGEDTILFGTSVKADDAIFEVVGNDLYIGLRNPDDATKTASQVLERIKVLNGGMKYEMRDGNANAYVVTSTTHNTVEFVQIAGSTIDLRKLNINWTIQATWNYGYHMPIALDLDDDGLDLAEVKSSDVVVKAAEGGLSRIGWVGPTDAFLAVDRDGDGAINKLSEISFTQDKPGATSDLEGLKTWDTNGDNLLDARDANFDKILVWQDLNQNGRSTAKELRTLTQAGIAAIELNGVATGYTAEMGIDSFVQHNMSFIWADGRAGKAYDVALARQVLGTEGLYAGEYQQEWGAKDGDGTLGRLVNDPKTAAKASRVQQKRALIETIGVSYNEIKAKAQVDFSDNDIVDAKVTKRWAKMSKSERAAWLSGQESGASSKIRGMTSEQSLQSSRNAATQATTDLVNSGFAQAGASVGSTLGDTLSVGSGATTPRASVGASPSTSSVRSGSVASSEPVGFAGPTPTSAGLNAQPAWWRQETQNVADGSNSLASLLSSMYGASAIAPTSGPDGTGKFEGMTQQQLLLLQSMASFGGTTGGTSAPIWARTTEASSIPVAASSGLKPLPVNGGSLLVA